MNFLEQLAINVILGVLQQVIKNPAKKAEMRAILLGLADDIDISYGLTPPAHD